MSRVERIEESRAPRPRPRETQPNPRKISRTPGLAEGDERTVDEALHNQEQQQSGNGRI